MTDDNPDTADSDKSIDHFSKDGRRDLVMNHKSQKCPGNQSDSTCTHHRQVRHVKTSQNQTDHQNHEVIHTEKSLDRGQILPFPFCGGEKIQSSSRSTGGKQAIADTAYNAQNRATATNMTPRSRYILSELTFAERIFTIPQMIIVGISTGSITLHRIESLYLAEI